MKSNSFFYRLELLPLLIFTVCLNNVSAQSGRSMPLPEPKSETIIVAAQAKEYPPCQKDPPQMLFIKFTKLNAFVEKLNDLGHCGYRLEKAAKFALTNEDAVRDMPLFGVVSLDPGHQYEYNWNVTGSPGELQTVANKQAAENFYFRQQFLFISGSCSEQAEKQRKDNESSGALGGLLNLGLGAKGSVSIFERKIGTIKKNEYRVVNGRVTGEKGEQQANEKAINEYAAKGFRPVGYLYLGMFNTHAVIMEKDEAVKPAGEYRLVTNYYGINKKFTGLSREGFRVNLVGIYFALVERTSKEPRGVKYYAASDYDEIQEKLAKWDQGGVQYETTGIGAFNIDCDPFESRWYFAVSEAAGNSTMRKTDHILFNPYALTGEYLRKKGIKVTRKTIPSEEDIDEVIKQANVTVNSYLKQGYRLSQVSMSSSVTLLFER